MAGYVIGMGGGGGGEVTLIRAITFLAGVDPDKHQTYDDLAADAEDMAKVAANHGAIVVAADYADVMTAFAASQTAMAAVAASQTAMAAVANSATARGAITASTTAINALGNSSLITTVTGSPFSSDNFTQVYVGLCFIVTARRTSSENDFVFNRVYSGTSTSTTQSSPIRITDKESPVNLFADGVWMKFSGSGFSNSSTHYFRIIKCA